MSWRFTRRNAALHRGGTSFQSIAAAVVTCSLTIGSVPAYADCTAAKLAISECKEKFKPLVSEASTTYQIVTALNRWQACLLDSASQKLEGQDSTYTLSSDTRRSLDDPSTRSEMLSQLVTAYYNFLIDIKSIQGSGTIMFLEASDQAVDFAEGLVGEVYDCR